MCVATPEPSLMVPSCRETRWSGLSGLPRYILIMVFKGYQYFLSPLFPPVCRFVPTCSQYAIEAVTKHGVLRGGLMTLWRIARCHPFARGGYDPVR